MENKKVSPQNNQNSFESLKTLSVLTSKNEFSLMFSRLQKARQTLEGLSNVVRSTMMNKKMNEKEPVQKPVEQKVVETPVVKEERVERVEKPKMDKPFGQRLQQGNFKDRPPRTDKPFGQRPQGSFGQKSQGTFGQKPQGTFGQKPQGDRRPQNGLQKPQGFGPKPFSKPDTSVPDTLNKKPERSFGNKQKNKSNFDDFDKKSLNKKAKIKMGYIVEDFGDEDEERIGRVRVNKKKDVKVAEKKKFEKAVITTDNLTVKILSEKIGKSVAELVKKCMLLGLMLNINSPIDFDTAELVAGEFGITLEKNVGKTVEETLIEEFETPDERPQPRPPIVTVMGHVDHGKTSLLDAIRKTNVSAGEAGGITQHIGAYSIDVNGNKITFIDTPGHEAFTSMRQRGAMVTDIAILVVAADDGIMPQTVEAIKYIKQAGVPMIVAINKMDKPEANPERIKQQLTEYEVIPEEWGGDAICVPISALTKKGLDKLLEAVLLVAEVSELKADPNRKGFGTVIESRVDKGRGVVANVIVKNGTLRTGDYVLCGLASGRVRGMLDHNGKMVKEATPSMAVALLGLSAVPEAGDLVYVTDEKTAKAVIEERMAKLAQEKVKTKSASTLEDFLATNIEDQKKKYNILVKADVQGSSEAIKQTLEKLNNEEYVVQCVSAGVGIVNETDVLLAQASNAVIIAFNTKIDAKAKQFAEKNKITIKEYNIIYEAVDFVTEQIDALLTPVYEEHQTGKAEIRQIFKISNIGLIAGCYVTEGVVTRGSKAKLIRKGEVVIDTTIDTLKMGKDDVKQAKEGFECGIKLKGFNDIKELDIIQTYDLVQVKRNRK